MKKIISQFLKSLFIVIFLISCSFPTKYYVSKIIDGDTIKLSSGKIVRYIGIDTPEIMPEPEEYAVEAKRLNKALVEGKEVKLEFDKVKKDKYDRILAYVYFNNQMVNSLMLSRGAAIVFNIYPNIKYADEFLALQKQAQILNKGIWRDKKPIHANHAKYFLKQIQTVTGKIVSVKTTDKTYKLYFSHDIENSFKLTIFKTSIPVFIEGNIDPETFYLNKRLLISGKIKDFNGPELVIGIPDEIMILK